MQVYHGTNECIMLRLYIYHLLAYMCVCDDSNIAVNEASFRISAVVESKSIEAFAKSRYLDFV